MSRVYLDANVFVYATGGDSPYREPCRAILQASHDGRIGGETSAYTVQEVVRQRRRRGDASATIVGRGVLAACSAVHPVDSGICKNALALMDAHPELDISDAVHAATALRAELAVVTADRAFDAIDGVARRDPLLGLAPLLSE